MKSKEIRKEMLYYFTQLNKKEQRSLLEFVKTFISSRKTSERQTIEEYNEELEQADAEIEAGNFITHEEVMKMLSK